MSNQAFTFKKFSINQNNCAMKIGTDAVILGAWATVENYLSSILDIGTGTGIIALMLSQRSDAHLIDAIEIDENAYEQCVTNFENSPWGDRLFCYHASLEEFTKEIEDKYDLIVSNPPFYSEDYKSENSKRDLARFQDAMPFKQLLESVSKLLSEEGKFSTIIPYSEEVRFIALASSFNLYPNKILQVKGNSTSEIKRSLLEFSFHKSDIKTETLVIESERHQYTQDYINLTKDFYLKM